MAAVRNIKYLPKKDKGAVINGFRFIRHADNNNDDKRKAVDGLEIFAFWGGGAYTEGEIYFATKGMKNTSYFSAA